MPFLTIYRASAGSGKTFTLSKEYIKLLLKNRDYQRRILAVTFTNKATEEMKSRIVRELYLMTNQSDTDYIKLIAEETDINKSDIPHLATQVLYHLLHDYSHFSVVTIDSFFQKVIRAFAKEMGLYSGYNVELDQVSVLNEAIDLMISDIDNNDLLKNWLVDWAEKKIEDGKSWNFKSDILKLGYEIFGEQLQDMDVELFAETTDKLCLERFIGKMNKIINDYEKTLKSIGNKALHIINNHNLAVCNFSYGDKGVAGFLVKIAKGDCTPPGKRAIEAINNPKAWYSKTSDCIEQIEDAYNDGLNEALNEAYQFIIEQNTQINSAKQVLRNLNVLGILADLMRHVNQYTRDQNLFMLSESSGFLKTIIGNSDAPFIYERIGSFYNHFMIDEFQDTSTIQWENFRPLINNSMASGYLNWIVGDVKQSIYRWRNTDWKILAEQVEKDMGSQNVIKESLSCNWRSDLRIVRFNNAFFKDATKWLSKSLINNESDAAVETGYTEYLAQTIEVAYEDYFQNYPKNKEGNKESGYVSLTTIANSVEKNWKDSVLEQLPKRIEQLQDAGYQLSDIAILVRKNSEAQIIADSLLAYQQANPDSSYRFDVLSNESLLINNASSIKWLVAALKFIITPDDILNTKYIQYEEMYRLRHESSGTKLQPLWEVAEHERNKYKRLPIYELTDLLIRQYDLYKDTEQAPFVQAFQDTVLHYTQQEATDIQSFIDWWEESKEKKFVLMPDNQQAIRLITIHKSKGLEFDAVIIPFCDWPMVQNDKTLWCYPQKEPFTDMPILPLKFETKLKETIFVKDYLKEKTLSYIDNLNLLYVAFTRAKNSLFICTPQLDKEGFNNVSELIHLIFSQSISDVETISQQSFITLKDYWDSESQYFEYGTLHKREQQSKANRYEQNEYLTQHINQSWKYIPHITRHTDYFSADSSPASPLDKGKLLHDIFKSIIKRTDLDRCLNHLINEGKIAESERNILISMIQKAMDNPLVGSWFEPGLQVKIETEILLPDGSTARPDRVIIYGNKQAHVIDYKFGQVRSATYPSQVRKYMKYMQQMGYESVKGFLWYVVLNEVDEVKE